MANPTADLLRGMGAPKAVERTGETLRPHIHSAASPQYSRAEQTPDLGISMTRQNECLSPRVPLDLTP